MQSRRSLQQSRARRECRQEGSTCSLQEPSRVGLQEYPTDYVTSSRAGQACKPRLLLAARDDQVALSTTIMCLGNLPRSVRRMTFCRQQTSSQSWPCESGCGCGVEGSQFKLTRVEPGVGFLHAQQMQLTGAIPASCPCLPMPTLRL